MAPQTGDRPRGLRARVGAVEARLTRIEGILIALATLQGMEWLGVY